MKIEQDIFHSILKRSERAVVSHNAKRYKGVSKDARQMCQIGKMNEEIGEFIQAVALNNRAMVEWIYYTDIRGSIESEAADVIIACLGIIYMWHAEGSVRFLPYCETRKENLVARMARAIEYTNPTNAISSVISYCVSEGIDIDRHVQHRLEYNGNLLREEEA
jgi:NTP pyrophosphatase (non-canonical NTP hydrolase)